MRELKKITAEVIATRLLRNGTVQVKVSKNGKILGNDYYDPNNKAETIKQSSIDYKLLKNHPDAQSMVKATAGYSAIIGSKDNRIVSSEKYGNFIVGPTTFTAHPESIRIGSFFRLNGLLTSTMPSTIITPVSPLVFDMPAKDTLKNLKNIIKEFDDLLNELL
jgi:hypothetical protein